MKNEAVSVILIRPQMGENIGAAARVMKNFGLNDLRIIAPRDGWPNPKAEEMAAHGGDIIHGAAVYDTLGEAIADCQTVYATTARQRRMEKPIHDVREAVQHMADDVQQLRTVGILFGPERSGLENEDLVLADRLLTIPVNPDCPSLNLAQAVAIVAYEWFAQNSESGLQTLGESDVAPKQELQGLFDHLETELDIRHFWKVDHKKAVMWRNIRTMLQRGNWSSQEVQTFRGIVSCLTKK